MSRVRATEQQSKGSQLSSDSKVKSSGMKSKKMTKPMKKGKKGYN
tara:strand:- start:577 stop:711 length:135 start_codon:yes stop_codon:yes gene_type:complete